MTSLTDLLSRTLGENIRVENELADDVGTVVVDPGQLENALLNLAVKPRDAMPRGGRLLIESANVELDADYVAAVKDVLPGTGSARAYAPGDDPLIRMRNTVILPGSSTLQQMIEGVEDGYWIVSTGNGQADSTTEFMFGVTMGYEIRTGRVGRAIRDTTVSGSALKVLASVDAVGDDLEWFSLGYCGKKQPMVVSEGGPSLRARAQLGGQ